jgi:hypothetical protein
LNVPKSLYESVPGTSGLVSSQRLRRFKSRMVIDLSRIRSAKCWRTPGGKLAAKHHTSHLVTQSLDFSRIGGTPEALGEIEELLLLSTSA